MYGVVHILVLLIATSHGRLLTPSMRDRSIDSELHAIQPEGLLYQEGRAELMKPKAHRRFEERVNRVAPNTKARCIGTGYLKQKCTRRRDVPSKVLNMFMLALTSVAVVAADGTRSTSSQMQPRGRGLRKGSSSSSLKRYFATCIPGLAPILWEELVNLGAKNVELSGKAGVSFQNDPASSIDIGMKALLWVRTAHRIMELVVSTEDDAAGDITDPRDLYDFIRDSVSIESLLEDGNGNLLTLSCSTILNGNVPQSLSHSHFTALTVKNALVDMVRDTSEDAVRPDVDIVDPDVPLVLVLRGNNRRGRDDSAQATLYRMLHSSDSLHKRGYRAPTIHKAAMKESLAAGLLLEAGFDNLIQDSKRTGLPAALIDPMTGSGTLCIEAALIAADFAPGLMRIKHGDDGGSKRNPHMTPPLMRWKGADKSLWNEEVQNAEKRAAAGIEWMKASNSDDPTRNNCAIFANEVNQKAFDLARDNIAKAGFSDEIELNEGDCVEWDLGGMQDEHSSQRVLVPQRSIVVCNPPWGLRLDEDIEKSWLSLNSFLREQCHESEAWILTGNKEATRHLCMKKSKSFPISTGDENLRWIRYDIFKKKPLEMQAVGPQT